MLSVFIFFGSNFVHLMGQSLPFGDLLYKKNKGYGIKKV